MPSHYREILEAYREKHRPKYSKKKGKHGRKKLDKYSQFEEEYHKALTRLRPGSKVNPQDVRSGKLYKKAYEKVTGTHEHKKEKSLKAKELEKIFKKVFDEQNKYLENKERARQEEEFLRNPGFEMLPEGEGLRVGGMINVSYGGSYGWGDDDIINPHHTHIKHMAKQAKMGGYVPRVANYPARFQPTNANFFRQINDQLTDQQIQNIENKYQQQGFVELFQLYVDCLSFRYPMTIARQVAARLVHPDPISQYNYINPNLYERLDLAPGY